MSNESRLSNSLTQIAIADFADEMASITTPTALGRLFRGTPTEFQMDAGALAASGSARQSAKIDFGASRAPLYQLRATVEFTAVAGVGDTIDFYMAPSQSGTPGTGNVGSTTGVDGAFTVEDDYLAQMTYIGSLSCDDGLVIQSGIVGVYSPLQQYGNLVMVNNADVNVATVVDELHAVFDDVSYGT